MIVWDVASGTALLTYRGHTDTVNDLAWSPDGTRIVSGSNDQTALIWDAATGGRLITYRAPVDIISRILNLFFKVPLPDNPIQGVSWSPDGSLIASVVELSHDVPVWNATTGETVFIYRGHNEPVTVAAWSPDGKLIASGYRDTTVQVWQLH